MRRMRKPVPFGQPGGSPVGVTWLAPAIDLRSAGSAHPHARDPPPVIGGYDAPPRNRVIVGGGRWPCSRARRSTTCSCMPNRGHLAADPFQVDEVDASGTYTVENGLLDGNDELGVHGHGPRRSGHGPLSGSQIQAHRAMLATKSRSAIR